jgi:predicted Fe-Mo cluster-binding NifX family protein
MKKIGVTSQNFRTITGHGGKARRFIIYGVDEDGGVEELDRLDLPKAMSLHNTIETSPHPIDELDYLITGCAGQGFIRKLAARHIEVVQTSASDPLLAVMSFAAGEILPPPELNDDHGHVPGAVGGTGGCGCGH